MKRINILYWLAASMLLLAPACTLEETPTSSFEKEAFFTTIENARMAVIGCYESLPGKEGYGETEITLAASDDLSMYKGIGAHVMRDLAHYATRSDNPNVEKIWNVKYEGLNRTNVVIASIEKMEDYADNDELKALVGEAKFLRAIYSYDLVRLWGDVPYTTNVQSGYGDALYGKRVDRAVIYEQVIQDLKDAIAVLPWSTETTSPEKANQGAARAMLMRACLHYAGYSLRADGTLQRPDDTKRAELFTEVTTQWQAFETDGAYHGFVTGESAETHSFLKFFKDMSAHKLESKESLFDLAYFTVDGQAGTAGLYGSYNGPLVAAPSGVAITEAFGRANSYVLTNPMLRDFYHADDLRRDVAIGTYQLKWQNGTHVKAELTPAGAKLHWPGKWRREWEPIGSVKNMNNTDINFSLLRYADAVLMAAEAYAQTGNEAKAWELINVVRARAGFTVDVSDTNYATYYDESKMYSLDGFPEITTTIMKAIYWERAFELAFENTRKYDLIRWGVLKEALLTNGEALMDKYASVRQKQFPAPDRFVPGKHELLPIPLAEIQINYNLDGINNPGY